AATGREMWEHHNFILRRDAGGAMTAVILFDPPVYKIPKGTPVAAGVRASDIVKPEGWEPTGTPFEWKPANPALPVQELVWSLQNQGLGWREDAQRMANDAVLYKEVRSALNDSEKERKVWARQHRIKL
ncbi:MAG: hypothetical protein ACAH83_01195, partial [Alphaproteobacteria bacterium]